MFDEELERMQHQTRLLLALVQLQNNVWKQNFNMPGDPLVE